MIVASNVRACMACRTLMPQGRLLPVKRQAPNSVPPPTKNLIICVCDSCGHIMAVNRDAGTVRNLTRAETEYLPHHVYAAEIRAHQERVVRDMIG